MSDKIAEVTPPPCVAWVASSDTDISVLTDRIGELARQVAALSASRSHPRSPSRTQHSRRTSRSAARSPAPDIFWYHRRGQINVLSGSSRYHTTLLYFPEIIRSADVHREPRHYTLHHIRTSPGPPPAYRPRRLAPDRIRIAKSEFDEMLRSCTTRRSDSPWASPLHLVPKKEDGWRPCGNYVVLNARTVPDQYPFRHIADFAHQLGIWKVFSTIDLVKAYHQITVHPTTLPRQPSSRPSDSSSFPICSSGSEMTLKHFSVSSMRFSGIWTSAMHI